jgi:hypothetical protein
VALLRQALGGKGRTALVALPGERGAGKSQLATAYARQCIRDGYDLVAWINAESARSRGWRCWPRICTWPAGRSRHRSGGRGGVPVGRYVVARR